MKWLFYYNGKSTSWYVIRTFALGWFVGMGISILIFYFSPNANFTKKDHPLFILFVSHLILAPILETLLIFLFLISARGLIILFARLVQKVCFQQKPILNKWLVANKYGMWENIISGNASLMTSIQIKISASAMCGLLAMFLHGGNDWGTYAGIYFLIMSLLFFTLAENSVWQAIKALVAVHFLANLIPLFAYVLMLILKLQKHG